MWLIVSFILLWLTLALMVVGILGRALALTLLWTWFVVPTFGAEPLSLPIAGGLITITYLVFSPKRDPASLRTRRERDPKDDDNTLGETWKNVGSALITELAVPGLAIAVGWIFKQAAGM